MWLYTSYARQPHRSVASKNGDFRYHGPKYKVLEVTTGIALASSLTAPPSFHRGCVARKARQPRHGVRPAPPTESLFNPVRRARGNPCPRVLDPATARPQ